MDHRLKYIGVVSGISGWVVILVAIIQNPWFVFTEHAFSDLGGRLAENVWVFNYGMMCTGLMVVLYGVYQTSIVKKTSGKIGSALSILSGILLFLIGAYPTGTALHFPVSVGFFGMTDLAIGVWGLELLGGENDRIGRTLLIMSFVGPVLAALIDWPSTATVEAFGILMMNIWVVLMTQVRLDK